MMNRRLLTYISAFALFVVVTVSYAVTPVNSSLSKQSLIEYHDSGTYDKEVKQVTDQALAYLKTVKTTPKKTAIILDIDETSLSNYQELQRLNFGATFDDWHQFIQKSSDKAISPTLELYRYALSHHMAVIFLTGRPVAEKAATLKNLQHEGYTKWEKIIFRSGKYKNTRAAEFKTAMRKQLVAKGYQIVLNIGDQVSDLKGGYAARTFKLPNPFYFIA